jgi:hypothetical protein
MNAQLQEIEDTLTGDRIVCSVFAGNSAKVSLEVLLPPDFPAERRPEMERYVAVAVKAVAERAGRDE